MIKVKDYPSDNYDERPEWARVKYLIYHYTEGNLEQSLCWLTDREKQVSSHYLICEQGEIYALVPEDKRAWHAGKLSRWGHDVRINATSIGIELVNCGNSNYTESQMQSLEALTRDILTRHDISPFNILGHSDVAPDRKIDPGDKFDWQRLARNGIGVYPEGIFNETDSPIIDIQSKLKSYGYPLEVSGVLDEQTECVLRAFQLHFGKGNVSAKLDWLLDAKSAD